MKQCSKCRKIKPLSEFKKVKRNKSGIGSRCLECARERSRKYKADNREKVSRYNRKYTIENKEKVHELFRKWYARNPNPERMRKYRLSNYEKFRESVRKWQAENVEKVREHIRNRRARVKGNGGKITAAEWKSVLDKYGHKCLYPRCDRTDVTMDHVIPLVLGGKHAIDNVQPLCNFHNRSKHTQHIDYRK